MQSSTNHIKIVQYMWGNHHSYRLCREINERYCRRHGYEYVMRNNPPREDRHCVWEKITSMREELADCDYLLFLDADAFVYAQELTLECELVSLMDNKCIMMASDIGSEGLRWCPEFPNNGVILVRNDPRTHEILKVWDECVEKPEFDHWRWNWRYEQAACWDTVWKDYRDDFRLLDDYYVMNGYHSTYIRHLMQMSEEERVRLMQEYIANYQPPSSWKFAIAVTTTNRRNRSTLQRTLESFRGTGFEPPVVFYDSEKKSDIWNWHRAMSYLVEHYPDADAYAIVEDDAIFAKDIRPYLEKSLWPSVREDGCVVSLFTPTIYTAEETWHQLNIGRYAWMSQFRIYHPKSARKLVQDIPGIADFESMERQNDEAIGEWLSRNEVDLWYHNPSLVQHTGMGMTTYDSKMGNNYEIGLARDFIGEHASASEGLAGWMSKRKPRRRVSFMEIPVDSETEVFFTLEKAEALKSTINQYNCDIGILYFIVRDLPRWNDMIRCLDTLRLTGKVLHIGLIAEPFEREPLEICWEIFDSISVIDRNEPDHLTDWHWSRHDVYKSQKNTGTSNEPEIKEILRLHGNHIEVLAPGQLVNHDVHYDFPGIPTENTVPLESYLAELDSQSQGNPEISSPGQPWQWGIGILTCDKRTKSTLQRTLESFRGTGFDPPQVFADLKKRCSIWNWHRAMSYLVERYPDANAYAILEDDIICANDIREYLEMELWPDVSEHGCICSIFTPTIYLSEERWHTENRGQNTWMSQFWIFHPTTARKLIQDIPTLTEFEGNKRLNDVLIGKWAIDNGVTIWHHSPSLIQHTGYNNIAYDQKLPINYRIGLSRNFVGEDFSATREMPFWKERHKPHCRVPRLDIFVNQLDEDKRTVIFQWTPEQAEQWAKKMDEYNCDIGEIRFIGDEPLLWQHLYECTEILRFTGKVMHIGLETDFPSHADPSPYEDLLDSIHIYETEESRGQSVPKHPVYRLMSHEENGQQRSRSCGIALRHHWIYGDHALLTPVGIRLPAPDTIASILNDPHCQSWDKDMFFKSIPEQYGR